MARVEQRLTSSRSDSGGGIYINEEKYLFAPTAGADPVRFIYLGYLYDYNDPEEGEVWFTEPEEFTD